MLVYAVIVDQRVLWSVYFPQFIFNVYTILYICTLFYRAGPTLFCGPNSRKQNIPKTPYVELNMEQEHLRNSIILVLYDLQWAIALLDVHVSSFLLIPISFRALKHFFLNHNIQNSPATLAPEFLEL